MNSVRSNNLSLNHLQFFNSRAMRSEAKFKEFEPQLKFDPRLKYGWFHLKLYSMFQDLSRRSIKTGFLRI